jgi:hypothetical protein
MPTEERVGAPAGISRKHNKWGWWRGLDPRLRSLLRDLLVVLPIVLVAVVLRFQLGTYEKYQKRAIPVLQAEIAQVPGIDNEQPSASQLDMHTEPRVEEGFRQTVSCDAVHAFYQEAAPRIGWLPGSADTNTSAVYDITFHTYVGGYYVELLIDCGEGTEGSKVPTEPAYYEVVVSALGPSWFYSWWPW